MHYARRKPWPKIFGYINFTHNYFLSSSFIENCILTFEKSGLRYKIGVGWDTTTGDWFRCIALINLKLIGFEKRFRGQIDENLCFYRIINIELIIFLTWYQVKLIFSNKLFAKQKNRTFFRKLQLVHKNRNQTMC